MTPKEQFLETPHAESHRKLVQTDAFREAMNYAMLQVLESHVISTEYINGAKAFRDALKNLPAPDEVPHGTQPPSLNYDAYDRPRRTG